MIILVWRLVDLMKLMNWQKSWLGPQCCGGQVDVGTLFSNLSLASKPRASFRIFPPCDDKDWVLLVLMCSPLCQVVCHIELEKVMRSTSLRVLAPAANKLTSWQLAPLFDTEPAWKKRTMYLPRSWENAGITSFDKDAYGRQNPNWCILSHFLQTFKIIQHPVFWGRLLISEWHQPKRSSLPSVVKTF